ncbi:zinc finger protein 347 [Stomoxys calcitrans]|uniref:zinc finger protein 347 n=1 Tax=Stomoxys calcitrans TaxID=35570 RepID=UPI0027E3392B|nr:zinc finger protein 347 [Stomoxys calcitrans]
MNQHVTFSRSASPEKASSKPNKESKVSKQNHIVDEISETGQLQYYCTACGKRFRSRTQKYYHLQCNMLHEKTFECDICKKNFARQSQLKYHKESHVSPINECTQCHKTFFNPLALKKHQSLHKVEPKTCPHCDKNFLKKISLEQHIAAQHLNQLQYGCAYCSKRYASKTTLQLHLQSHERKRFECLICGKFFQRNSILNLHLKRHNHLGSIYKCHVCEKTFGDTGALSRHRKIHEENSLQYHCILCDKSILRKDNMTRHIKTIHPEEKYEDIVQILNVSPPQSFKENDLDKAETNHHNANHVMNYTERSIPTSSAGYKSPVTNIVIIENKLIQSPIQTAGNHLSVERANKHIQQCHKEETSNDNSKHTTLYESFSMNKIQVITALPTNKTTSIHIVQNNHETLPYPHSAEENDKSKNDVQLEKSEIDLSNHYSNERFKMSLSKNLQTVEFEDQQQNIESHHSCEERSHPLIIHNTPSVIRSVGNVNRNLNLPIVSKPVAVNDNTAMDYEYKHKKYNHHYNVDLYRKILGCDDEEDNENFVETQRETNATYNQHHQQDNSSESTNPTTAVHWRKSFKNIYETTAT